MKRTTVTLICDVCKHESSDGGVKTIPNHPVVFVTEQTEGRSTKPHIVMNSLDLCTTCEERVLTTREMPTAAGAQGSNRYWFASEGTRT